MRYLILSSFLFILVSCSTVYSSLQQTDGNSRALERFKPAFRVALYKTAVDVAGNHLSGLLLIKKMPDSTIRLVFSNETGFKFFDFEFSPAGDFKVYAVIKKMNKRSVLKTLRKDFQIILMQGLNYEAAEIRKENDLLYYIFPEAKGYNCYITNSSGDELIRMERSSKSKPVASMIMKNYINGIPDTIGVTHHNFNFTIGLKRIER